MNPSSSGWLNKHLPVFKKGILSQNYTRIQFYSELKRTGFIYANSLSTISYPQGTSYPLTLEEASKVNLFDSLGYMYFTIYPDSNEDEFISAANRFYDYLKEHSWFKFELPFIKQGPETKLEKIIHDRIKTNESLLKRNFSALIANALLFLDVLTFRYYLENNDDPVAYAQEMEALLANTLYFAVKQKNEKTKHEEIVLKLLEASLRYNKIEDVLIPYEQFNYGKHQLPLECQYILDLTCITVYADAVLEDKERRFILHLGASLGFTKEETKEHVLEAKRFITEHREELSWLDDSNPFRNLYDNTYQMVSLLVIRNKKRLSQEIRESKELADLLMKSTTTELDAEEKDKVKEQLLDICKAIPSLTVFMLPGGTILLPLLVKLIPDLLPSAFADNRIGKEEK